MKKTAKALVVLLFCLSIFSVTLMPASAASVGTVKGLKASAITYNSAKLTWTAVSKAKTYVVETQSGKNWKTVATVKTNSYTVSKLTTGTTYKYRVYAKNVWGQKGAVSSTVSVKPMPAKVGGLKVASVTYNSAKLTWTKVAGATGYQVQKYDGKKWVNLAKVSTNAYTASKLTINVTYKYRVAAYRTVSKKTFTGAYSSTVSAKPALAKAIGVKASVASPTSIKITWSKVAYATGYKVQQYNPSKKTWSTVKGGDVKTTSFTHTGLTPNTTYKYRVFAYIIINKKTYLAPVSSEVSAKPVPPTVTGVKVSVASPTSAKLTWNKVSGVKGYKIQLCDANGKWATKITTTATSCTVSNLTPNTTHKMRVFSYVNVSKKDYPSAASAVVSVKPVPPTVTGVKASAASASSVKVTWNKVSGSVTGYKVQICDASGKWTTLKPYLNASTTSFTATNLNPNATHKFRVFSYVNFSKKDYPSAASSVVSVSLKMTAPSAPINTQSTDSAMTLKWNSVKNVTGYVLEQASGSSWKTVAKTKDTTYTVENLAKSTAYKFRVRSYLTVGSTDYTSAASAEKTYALLANVNSLNADRISDTALDLRWNVVDGATGYNIYVYDAAQGVYTFAGTSKPFTAEIKTVEKRMIDLMPSNNYKFAVEPYFEANGVKACGPMSNEIEATTKDQYYKVISPTIPNAQYYYLSRTDSPRVLAYARSVSLEFPITNTNDIKVSVAQSSNAVNVSWTKANGATKYIVQSRSNGIRGYWVDEIKTDKTSAVLYLAPNTSFEIRVLACDNNYQTYAYIGNGTNSPYQNLKDQPYSVSEVKTIKTKAAPAFANSNEAKTLYTLMVAQAINNTKAEQGNVKLVSSTDMKSNIDHYYLNGRKFDSLKLLMLFMGVSSDDLDFDLDLNDSADFNGTFVNGVSTIEKDGEASAAYLHSSITPNDTSAYLYNAWDLNNFSKKVSNVKYTANSNGTKTIVLTLPKEEIKNTGGSTAVHDGLAQGATNIMSELNTSDGMSIERISTGATTITAVINKNNTLNSLTVNSALNMMASYTGATDDSSMTIGVEMTSSTNTKYNFSR